MNTFNHTSQYIQLLIFSSFNTIIIINRNKCIKHYNYFEKNSKIKSLIPLQTGQSCVQSFASPKKGSLENNHKEICYICPKETDLKEVGFDSQEKAKLMVSHINFQPKENLKGKSPLEMMEFLSPDLYKKFIDFGIKKIENDEIILKPYLLRSF